MHFSAPAPVAPQSPTPTQELHTHGICSCGLLMNNDATYHCAIPSRAADGNPFYAATQVEEGRGIRRGLGMSASKRVSFSPA